MITVLHSYLNGCEHGADWHSILFNGIIRHPDDLSNYIKSIESENVDVSLKHKQMLLNMINTSVENPTVFSEVINGIQLGEQMHRFSVNVIFDLCTSHFNNGIAVFVQNEEAWLHLNIGSKTIECWIPYQSMTIAKVVIDASEIQRIQIKKYVSSPFFTFFLNYFQIKLSKYYSFGTCLACEIIFKLKCSPRFEGKDIPFDVQTNSVHIYFDTGFITHKLEKIFVKMVRRYFFLINNHLLVGSY